MLSIYAFMRSCVYVCGVRARTHARARVRAGVRACGRVCEGSCNLEGSIR